MVFEVLLDFGHGRGVLLVGGHPKLDPEVGELHVFLPLDHPDSAHAFLDLGEVACDQVEHNLLPGRLYLFGTVVFELYSKLGPVFVGFVLPLGLDASLEELDGANHVVELRDLVLEHFEFFLGGVEQNLVDLAVGHSVPSLEKADHVVEPSHSAHLGLPVNVLVLGLVEEVDVLPDGPLLVIVELEFRAGGQLLSQGVVKLLFDLVSLFVASRSLGFRPMRVRITCD